MQDVLYVTITVAFFALAAGFVRVCDRIIGPDPTPGEHTDPAAGAIEVIDLDETDPTTVGVAK